MRFEQLLFLIEVHRCPSLTAACEKLHVTRQALSSALRNLEQELGAELLNRTVRGVTLTEKGYEVLAFAEQVAQLQQEFLASFYRGQQSPEICGQLLLLTTGPLRAMIMPQLLAYFLKHHPQLKLDVDSASASEIQKALLSGAGDLIFLHQLDGPLAELTPLAAGLVFTPLFTGHPCIWCSKKSPLARQNSVTPQEACRYPTIIDSQVDQTIFQAVLKYCGQPRIAAILDSRHIYVLEKFLEDDIGILWDYQAGSNTLYRAYSANPRLQIVPLDFPCTVRGGYALRQDADRKAQPLATLLAYLKQAFR